jgi:hypothetical protein
MSNHHKLEIRRNDTDEGNFIELAFWDSIHGEDEFFQINEDDQAFKFIERDDDGNEVVDAISLYDALSALLDKLAARQSAKG